jgi:hypothetical protein
LGCSGWEYAPERLALANVYHEVAAVIGWDAAVDFGFEVWRTKRPPSRRDGKSHDRRGAIYIPRTISEKYGRDLVSIAGANNAARLVEAFAGATLFFPDILSASKQRRNEAIAEQVRSGFRVATVAALFEMDERHIRAICKQHGVSPRKALPAMRARCKWRQAGVREAVLEAGRSGECVEAAAREWGFAPDVAHAIMCEGQSTSAR